MNLLNLTMVDFKAIRQVIASQQDVIACRQAVRKAAVDIGFSLADQTRLATAASELTRNALRHAGGGVCMIHAVQSNGRDGLQILIEDEGPGIADIKQAMEDGYSTDKSLGLGLPAANRLVHAMDIDSQPGKTVIRIDMYLA